jgi:uncharacterized protein YecE (DUF72 family)
MLGFYAGEFDTVEVNSTYYRILHPRVSSLMAGKTPEGFRFFVKLHESMTHSRSADGSTWQAFHAMLEPFASSGRLAGLLAQFPWAFRPSDETLAYVASLPERAGGFPVAVEFRNALWYEGDLLERVAGQGVAPVSVDLPPLPGLPPCTPVGGSPFGYVRFHGRNSTKWWGGGPLRYDYEYTRPELAGWLPGIMKLLEKSGRAFIFFNNCHGGQAVRSARLMKSLLEGEQ